MAADDVYTTAMYACPIHQGIEYLNAVDDMYVYEYALPASNGLVKHS